MGWGGGGVGGGGEGLTSEGKGVSEGCIKMGLYLLLFNEGEKSTPTLFFSTKGKKSVTYMYIMKGTSLSIWTLSRAVQEVGGGAKGLAFPFAPPPTARERVQLEQVWCDPYSIIIKGKSVTVSATGPLLSPDLKPLLVPEAVTELVVVSMRNLPRHPPRTFKNSYTPIAAAGTDAQVLSLWDLNLSDPRRL